jgi:uncharacterized membrane protein YjgN (DUF898 family)
MHADPAAAGDTRLPIRFVGSGSEYFRIWIVNLLLTLVTLGLYYPYAKVRRLRYFHGSTELGGHPMSFHGDPHKMLRGYLLVGVLFLVYAGAGHFSATAGLVAFMVVALVWPALWHSALRFRMSNTGWRGMRFQFTGSRSDAYRALAPSLVVALLVIGAGLLAPAPSPDAPPEASAETTPLEWVALLFPLLMVFAAPALLWLMRRYQQGHLALGAEHTRFEVPLGRFYLVTAKAFALLLVFAFVAGMVVALAAGGLAAAGGAMNLGRLMVVLVALLILLLVAQVVVAPYFVTRMQNLVWNGTRSPKLHFHSALRARDMMKLSLRNWLLIIVTLGLYFPFAAVAIARLRLEAVQVSCAVDPDALFGSAARANESAAGDAAGDIAGIDIGL